MTDLRIEALDYARRLTAALEQYAEGTPQQIEALRAELDKVRHRLHEAGNVAIWSAGVLRGEPVPPRNPCVPISLLEVAASEARTKITEQAHEINSRDNQIDQMAADLAKLTSRASIAEAASREKDKQLAEAHDRIHQLEKTHDQQVAAFSVTIRNLQEDHLVKNVGAERLRERLTEANDTITKQADVIKELHAQHHELEARKQGVQYDLDRAKEEIEFAEAEIAKYKPLIEAVRGGFVYGFRGQWVRVNAATVSQVINGMTVSFHIPNSEDPQCL